MKNTTAGKAAMMKAATSRAAMTMGAALITAILFGSAAVEGSSYKYEEAVSKSISVEGAKILVIESLSGDIIVTGEEGREVIELKIIKIVRAEDEEAARKIAESMGVVVTRPEEMIKIETRYPKKGKTQKSIFSIWFERGQSMSISMTLTVPAGLMIETATASGDVEIGRIQADVEASTASGDIMIRDIDGDVEANVASGNIAVDDVTGSVVLSSAAGDIVVRNVGGDAEIRVATGDTELTAIGGSLELSTYTGDSVIDGVGAVLYEGISGSARFVDVRGAVEASAASGDLNFRVAPEGLNNYLITTSSGNIALRFLTVMEDGYILKAATTSGEITARLPITVTKVDRNRIAGIVRDGRAKIFLETSGGNITIEEPED
jgi:DUF4097 and DUF4098 domain-containing protein YvlB